MDFHVFRGPTNKNGLNFSVKTATVFLKKTRVGFGRTELWLRLFCTEFCALSSGRGPRGQGFEGEEETLDFHDFFGGSKTREKIAYASQQKQVP